MDSGIPQSHGNGPENQPSRIARAGVAVTAGWPVHENREAAVRGAGFVWPSWPSRRNKSTCKKRECRFSRLVPPALWLMSALS